VRRSGGAVGSKINLLPNTTPALRATPPRLRRGLWLQKLKTVGVNPRKALDLRFKRLPLDHDDHTLKNIGFLW